MSEKDCIKFNSKFFITVKLLMKAIITAAGLGTRSGLNGIIRKELLNIYDYRDGSIILRPIIDVLIHNLQRVGIRDIAVVLDNKDAISQLYLKETYPSVNIIFQKEKKGFGDAILSAADFFDEKGMVVAAGDGLILDLDTAVKGINEKMGEDWKLFVMKVANPSSYGVAVLDRKSYPYKVMEVVEKPSQPKSNFAICAFYYLPPEILRFIRYDSNGNAELTDGINEAIKSGISFSAIEIRRNSWISVGKAESYASVLKRSYDFAVKKELHSK
jgi:glucose-1-phosphate thymidylyltransferase